MALLDNYTDEELGRIFRAAAEESGYQNDEATTEQAISTLEIVCTWLDAFGLGVVSASIKTAVWAWHRLKTFWRRRFRRVINVTAASHSYATG